MAESLKKEEEKKLDEGDEKPEKETNIAQAAITVDTKKKLFQGSTSKLYASGTDRVVKVVEKTFKRPYAQERKCLIELDGLGITPKVFTIDKAQMAFEMELGLGDLKVLTLNKSKKKEQRYWDELELTKMMRQLFTFIKAMDKVTVYHTDISLQNIILKDAKTTEIRLIDFGKGVLDVTQHPRINKIKTDGFEDVKRTFEIYRLQCLQFECESIIKLSKELIWTCIYKPNTEIPIRNCKFGDEVYWKVFNMYYSGLQSFFQTYTEPVVLALDEQGIQDMWKKIGVY